MKMTARKPLKSLAQALFEASPTVGWQGTWDRLGEPQRQWWEAYAEVARAYLASYEHISDDLVDPTPDESDVDSATCQEAVSS
jgi:hypothetical protein